MLWQIVKDCFPPDVMFSLLGLGLAVGAGRLALYVWLHLREL
jgi:hypothetical protein